MTVGRKQRSGKPFAIDKTTNVAAAAVYYIVDDDDLLSQLLRAIDSFVQLPRNL